MQIVIDIPEEIYKASKIIDGLYENVIQIPLEVIANGTVLPKHGDLIDAYDLQCALIRLSNDTLETSNNYHRGIFDAMKIITNAPTILEAWGNEE